MRLAVLAAALTLTACSQPETAPQAEPAAAPATPPGRDAVYEAARQSPDAFVRAIYDAYAAGKQTPTPAGQDPIYSRMANARLGADSMRPGGARLSRDPLCDCVTPSGLTVKALAVAQASPTEAQANVAFTEAGRDVSLKLTLLKEGPMWRVEDVQKEGGSPLSEEAMRGLN